MWIKLNSGLLQPIFLSKSLLLALIFFGCTGVSSAVPDKEKLTTPGLVREFNAPPDQVRQAVMAVVKDQIVHGTLVFDKEPILTGAEAVDSTSLFDPWKGPGEIFYKIRRDAIAPRHFTDSGDQGTIGVRYVLIPVDENRCRVKVDAIYMETAHRVYHASDGNVEKSELKAIQEYLNEQMAAAEEAADARRRQLSAELVKQSIVRQREDETTRLSTAKSSVQDLEQQVNALHHELERRIKAPGTDMKAAPFKSAATFKNLQAYTEVVVLIITDHWLGVETPEGQRGWVPADALEPLP